MEGAEIAIICGSIGGAVFLVVFLSITRLICRKARKVEVVDPEFNAEEALLSNGGNKTPSVSTITTGSHFYNYNETNNEIEIFPEFPVQVHSTIYDLDLTRIRTRPKDKPKVLLPKKLNPENNNTFTPIPPSLHPISEEFCVLVIAVDATPEGVGGYCVNLIEKSCETYYLKTHQMPWSLQRHNDSSEFEMKNLMFALMLWEPEIIRNRLFKIYTDNTAINSSTNKFGFVAAKLLKHCDNCIGFNVRRVNKNPYCNSGRNWSEFVKYIQPADHLSRGQQDLSEKLIHSYYGIPYDDFKRSHKPSDRNQINSEFMEKVNATVDRWKKRCDSCGYSYRLGALKYVGPRGGRTHKTKNHTSQNRYR